MRELCKLCLFACLMLVGVSPAAHAQSATTGSERRQVAPGRPAESSSAPSPFESNAEQNGSVLYLTLGWTSEGQTFGQTPKIIVRSDNLIVSTMQVSSSASDAATGCINRVRAGHRPNTSLSADEMQQLLDCRKLAVRVDAASPRNAIFLPLRTGPRKCTENDLTNGSYRICAALLQQSPDSFRLEYEEGQNVNGKLAVTRTRFEVTLQRRPTNSGLYGRIEECQVSVLDALAFDPKQPRKMQRSGTIRIQRCAANYIH